MYEVQASQPCWLTQACGGCGQSARTGGGHDDAVGRDGGQGAKSSQAGEEVVNCAISVFACRLPVPLRAQLAPATNVTESDRHSASQEVVSERVERAFEADSVGSVHVDDQRVLLFSVREKERDRDHRAVFACSIKTQGGGTPSGFEGEVLTHFRWHHLGLMYG